MSVVVTVLVEGSRVFGKALARTFSDIVFKNIMSKKEAEMILNLPENFNNNELENIFHRVYSANSKENHGSPYIQEKVLGAYTVLCKQGEKKCSKDDA